MKLEQRIKGRQEYRCELTKELDSISGISEKHYYDRFYHYILADKVHKNRKVLPIRVPGGTVGGIWIDNNIITKIVIDKGYVVKTYPDDVNDIVQKFIGQTLDW